jgi:nucleotide-binding universal stress UspA family protein
MKILVPVDGSPFTKRMLGYLAANKDWLGAGHEFTMITAVSAVPSRAATVIDDATLKGYYDSEAEKVFRPIRSFFARKPDFKVAYSTKVGVAGDVIATAATKGGYDLIIMGSHGHGTLTNLVMGSVATKVLANCKVPVLLIR